MWSDVAHKVIAAARLNGSAGLAVLVNSSINVAGKVCLLVCL